MTQMNIDRMDIIVNELMSGIKIADALKKVYKQRHIILPHDEELLKVGLEKLNMSNKTTNALFRNRMQTLNDVVNYCNVHKITNLKLFGRSAGIELFESILNYMWDNMSNEERKYLLIDIVERNEDNAIL